MLLLHPGYNSKIVLLWEGSDSLPFVLLEGTLLYSTIGGKVGCNKDCSMDTYFMAGTVLNFVAFVSRGVP